MEAKKHHKQFTSLLGAALAVGLISLVGCDREERAELADEFGDKVVEAIQEEEYEEDMYSGDCDGAIEECGEEGEEESGEGDEEEFRDGEDDFAGENPDEEAPDNPDDMSGENGEWDYFGELEDLELSNAKIGGQFGEDNKPEHEGVLEGFDEGEFTQIELWSLDRTSMLRIEVYGGIAHAFFQTPGQKLIVGEDATEDIMIGGLDVVVATCYGDFPWEMIIDIPAHKITIVTVDGGVPGVVTVNLTLEALNPDTNAVEEAFASFDVTQVK